ncbi:hypothetical protein S40285_00887 [Stachybotrys chlorohalonatus IBT 40285]|uniref:BHLH domain-containing protein n=1 Tax=Stachybotrys chlorohalonatus (strain IBT 40285) TaxID=1283841 RepID=A0A084QJP9_STAC4|nr:hypothetical protein S40285_00887 [Stachybotrys chlorohalonata IBT 40285]
MPTLEPQSRVPAAKAAGLTNILNSDDQSAAHNGPPSHLRDSGFYSTTEASSKHTSAASFSTTGLSPTASGYQSSSADKTPSPVASNLVPHALVSPAVSHMSVASMVSPTASASADPRRFDRPISLGSNGPSGATLGDNLASGLASRRESVDSRINQGISDMRLGNSPYASNNHSTTSIQSTLHSQRNPRPGLDNLSVHRISNGYQPSADRVPEPKTVRTAPAITGPATSHIARAAEPTKGQAWAFPEEEIHRMPPHYSDSRRSSITESVASSQLTAESRLPMGQRRLDDGSDYARMSSVPGEYPPVHHHSMQPKQLSDLQSEEGGAAGNQPYSRTPELRVSHKLAERKRRTEMKELFDQLRDLMPQERGSKASKWEILTKAIAEHQRQSEYIRALQSHYNAALQENDNLRREIHSLRGDLGQSAAHQSHQGPPPAPGAQGPAGPFSSEHYAPSNRTELPPLRAISSGIPNGPESMTGVQYEAPRLGGYRPERY